MAERLVRRFEPNEPARTVWKVARGTFIVCLGLGVVAAAIAATPASWFVYTFFFLIMLGATLGIFLTYVALAQAALGKGSVSRDAYVVAPLAIAGLAVFAILQTDPRDIGWIVFVVVLALLGFALMLLALRRDTRRRVR